MSKAYVFVNRYCKGIQAGIQAAHALTELSLSSSRYENWAVNDKTIVVLSAQSHDELENLIHRLYSFDYFSSDTVGVFQEECLNNATTAVAFIADNSIINIQNDIAKWRADRSLGFGKKRSEFDQDMRDAYGDAYDLVLLLEGYRSHAG